MAFRNVCAETNRISYMTLPLFEQAMIERDPNPPGNLTTIEYYPADEIEAELLCRMIVKQGLILGGGKVSIVGVAMQMVQMPYNMSADEIMAAAEFITALDCLKGIPGTYKVHDQRDFAKGFLNSAEKTNWNRKLTLEGNKREGTGHMSLNDRMNNILLAGNQLVNLTQKVPGGELNWQRVCTIQFSSFAGPTAVLQINHLSQLPSYLRNMLENPSIIKLVLGTKEETKALKAEYGIEWNFEKGVIDVQYIAQNRYIKPNDPCGRLGVLDFCRLVHLFNYQAKNDESTHARRRRLQLGNFCIEKREVPNAELVAHAGFNSMAPLRSWILVTLVMPEMLLFCRKAVGKDDDYVITFPQCKRTLEIANWTRRVLMQPSDVYARYLLKPTTDNPMYNGQPYMRDLLQEYRSIMTASLLPDELTYMSLYNDYINIKRCTDGGTTAIGLGGLEENFHNFLAHDPESIEKGKGSIFGECGQLAGDPGRYVVGLRNRAPTFFSNFIQFGRYNGAAMAVNLPYLIRTELAQYRLREGYQLGVNRVTILDAAFVRFIAALIRAKGMMCTLGTEIESVHGGNLLGTVQGRKLSNPYRMESLKQRARQLQINHPFLFRVDGCWPTDLGQEDGQEIGIGMWKHYDHLIRYDYGLWLKNAGDHIHSTLLACHNLIQEAMEKAEGERRALIKNKVKLESQPVAEELVPVRTEIEELFLSNDDVLPTGNNPLVRINGTNRNRIQRMPKEHHRVGDGSRPDSGIMRIMIRNDLMIRGKRGDIYDSSDPFQWINHDNLITGTISATELDEDHDLEYNVTKVEQLGRNLVYDKPVEEGGKLYYNTQSNPELPIEIMEVTVKEEPPEEAAVVIIDEEGTEDMDTEPTPNMFLAPMEEFKKQLIGWLDVCLSDPFVLPIARRKQLWTLTGLDYLHIQIKMGKVGKIPTVYWQRFADSIQRPQESYEDIYHQQGLEEPVPGRRHEEMPHRVSDGPKGERQEDPTKILLEPGQGETFSAFNVIASEWDKPRFSTGQGTRIFAENIFRKWYLAIGKHPIDPYSPYRNSDLTDPIQNLDFKIPDNILRGIPRVTYPVTRGIAVPIRTTFILEVLKWTPLIFVLAVDFPYALMNTRLLEMHVLALEDWYRSIDNYFTRSQRVHQQLLHTGKGSRRYRDALRNRLVRMNEAYIRITRIVNLSQDPKVDKSRMPIYIHF